MGDTPRTARSATMTGRAVERTEMTAITLRPIDRQNWRAALALTVRPEQQRFVADHAPIAALVLAKAYVGAGGLTWTPYLIEANVQPIGLVALAYTPDSADDYWVYHFFIDHTRQGHGHGRQALRALIAVVVAEHPACRQINLTAHPENAPAQRLYAAAGFAPTGALHDGEPVYRLILDR